MVSELYIHGLDEEVEGLAEFIERIESHYLYF